MTKVTMLPRAAWLGRRLTERSVIVPLTKNIAGSFVVSGRPNAGAAIANATTHATRTPLIGPSVARAAPPPAASSDLEGLDRTLEQRLRLRPARPQRRRDDDAGGGAALDEAGDLSVVVDLDARGVVVDHAGAPAADEPEARRTGILAHGVRLLAVVPEPE